MNDNQRKAMFAKKPYLKTKMASGSIVDKIKSKNTDNGKFTALNFKTKKMEMVELDHIQKGLNGTYIMLGKGKDGRTRSKIVSGKL